jgi:hypothetical protein
MRKHTFLLISLFLAVICHPSIDSTRIHSTIKIIPAQGTGLSANIGGALFVKKRVYTRHAVGITSTNDINQLGVIGVYFKYAAIGAAYNINYLTYFDKIVFSVGGELFVGKRDATNLAIFLAMNPGEDNLIVGNVEIEIGVRKLRLAACAGSFPLGQFAGYSVNTLDYNKLDAEYGVMQGEALLGLRSNAFFNAKIGLYANFNFLETMVPLPEYEKYDPDFQTTGSSTHTTSTSTLWGPMVEYSRSLPNNYFISNYLGVNIGGGFPVVLKVSVSKGL